MAHKFKKGKYVPKNPDKYKGDVNNIIYRSSWEQRFNAFLDNNPNVLEWGSEEFYIPYIKPTDGKVHRYFPDYWIKYKNTKGEVEQRIIEVKPHTQTKRSRSRNPKTKLYEDVTFAINLAKWKAAQQFCDQQGIVFQIVTEKELFRS